MPGSAFNIEYHLGTIQSEFKYCRKTKFDESVSDENIEQYFVFMTKDSWPAEIFAEGAELLKFYNGVYTPTAAVKNLSPGQAIAILIAARLYLLLIFIMN